MALGRYSPRGAWARALVALAMASPFTPARAAHPEADADAIPWREDYGVALEEARAGDQPLWIQFTGPWCPNCLRMEQDSFTDSAVRERAQSSLVPLKLQSDAHVELAMSLGLSGLPASVILDPSRRVLAARQGYLGPEELVGFLDGAVAALDDEQKDDRATEDSPLAESADATEADAPVALAGYCPVGLVSENHLVPGRGEFSFEYEGRLYKCADQASLDAFRRDPERHVPAVGGDCPVSRIDRGRSVAGDPRWSVLYQERLYLCASETERLQFVENPGRYAVLDADRGSS